MSKDTPEIKDLDVPKTSKDLPKKESDIASKSKADNLLDSRKTKSWIIITAALLFIITGGLLAWSLQPANAVMGGISSLVKSRDQSFGFELRSMEDGEMKPYASGMIGYKNAKMHIQAETSEGENGKTALEVKHLGEGETYAKLTGLESIVLGITKELSKTFSAGFSEEAANPEEVDASMDEAMTSMITPLIAPIEDKWLSIDSKSIEESLDNDLGSQYQCLEESIRLIDKRATRNEVRKLYKEHPFVVIDKKLGSKDGANGYSVSVDQDKLDDMNAALKQTDFFKKIQGCTESEDQAEEMFFSQDSSIIDPSDLKNLKAELWIQRFTNKLQTAELMTLSEDGEMETSIFLDFTKKFDPDFNKPSESKSIKEALKGLGLSAEAPVEGNIMTDEELEALARESEQGLVE